MSKKHKEKSMWDFTYEEQQAMLNSFDKKMDINSSSIETKNTDDNITTPKYDSINNFPSMEDQLMEFIKENNDNNTTNDDAALATICVDTGDKDIVIADNPIPITDNTVQDKVTLSSLYGTKLTNLNDMSIKVEYIDELDKLIIDDGTTKKTFAIDRAVEDNIYDISEEDFDEEDVSDKMSLLLGYIITCQHPYVIVPTTTFEKDFGNVKSFDFKSFFFVRVGAFMCIYVLSEENRDNLISLMSTYEMTKSECMNFWVGLAFHCGVVNNAFYVENIDYVSTFMNMTIDKYENFKAVFFKDPETTVSDSEDLECDISEYVDDCKFVQSKAREFLKIFTEDWIDGDDEDDEDDDDDTDILSIEEASLITPEEVSNTGETTASNINDNNTAIYKKSMHQANMMKTPDVNNEEEDDGDMTFPVMTRDS